MSDVRWYWILALALTFCVAIVLALRFRERRWPRPLAMSAVGAILSMVLFDDDVATRAILLTGLVLTIVTATAERK